MTWMLRITTVAFVVLAIRAPQAYPRFVTHGYTSCALCHVNPYGGGPLSDYGHAVLATTLAAKPPFLPELGDETLAAYSGAPGSQHLPTWLRYHADFRGLYFNRYREAEHVSRVIPMDLQAGVALRASPLLSGVLTLAYQPPKRSASPAETASYSPIISREHYLAYRHSLELGIYAGMMDKIFGLRLVDHESLARKRTGLAQNDQSHGLLFDNVGDTWEVGLNVFAGNLFQEAKLRQSGFSARGEIDIRSNWRMGVSALASHNAFRSWRIFALHNAMQLPGGRGLLSEVGLFQDQNRVTPGSALGAYAYSEFLQDLMRGLQLFVNAEFESDRAFKSATRNYRGVLGLQYFPMQRVEIELSLGRLWVNEPARSSATFTTSLLAQLHVYL